VAAGSAEPERKLPSHAEHVVVGGGVHGLSVATALAKKLRKTDSTSPSVVLLERAQLGAGATGVAGGIVRNYYRSPAITEIVRLSVDEFERAPESFGFHQVGFLAIVPKGQVADLEAIAARQAEVGFASELVTGAAECAEYLTWLWPDFDAGGVEAVLHERRSGWADVMATVRELARQAREVGAAILEGVGVTGIETTGRSVTALVTNEGSIRCDHVTFACGVWARDVWRMLDRDFTVRLDETQTPLVHLVKAQEGDFTLPGVGLQARAGREAPVIHFDAADPLQTDDGRTLVDGAWGTYFRMGRTGTGVTLGGLPVDLGPDASLEPYGPKNPAHIAEDEFHQFAAAALARVLRRFRRTGKKWRSTLHGGLAGLTPDGYPVLDRLLDNAYVILDAGHTYKMLALGPLVAADIMDEPVPLLEPFRLSRFETHQLQPSSSGPFPWT
jgi:methylglutamate dehydrogenase subunit A